MCRVFQRGEMHCCEQLVSGRFYQRWKCVVSFFMIVMSKKELEEYL